MTMSECHVILNPSTFHIIIQMTGLKLKLQDRTVTSFTVSMVKRGNKIKV
jgi:hypothetical protein